MNPRTKDKRLLVLPGERSTATLTGIRTLGFVMACGRIPLKVRSLAKFATASLRIEDFS
jgi:hypothetical protein